MRCWFSFCATHPYKDVRRAHVELYLRELEPGCHGRQRDVVPANLDTQLMVFLAGGRGCGRGRPGCTRAPTLTSPTSQPWLDRNELTDLLAAAENEGGYRYALVCLLA